MPLKLPEPTSTSRCPIDPNARAQTYPLALNTTPASSFMDPKMTGPIAMMKPVTRTPATTASHTPVDMTLLTSASSPDVAASATAGTVTYDRKLTKRPAKLKMLMLAPVAAKESEPSRPMMAQSIRDMTGSSRSEKSAGMARPRMSLSCLVCLNTGTRGLNSGLGFAEGDGAAASAG